MSNKQGRHNTEHDLDRAEYKTSRGTKIVIWLLIGLLVLGVGSSIWWWYASQAKAKQRQIQQVQTEQLQNQN